MGQQGSLGAQKELQHRWVMEGEAPGKAGVLSLQAACRTSAKGHHSSGSACLVARRPASSALHIRIGAHFQPPHRVPSCCVSRHSKHLLC